MDFELGALSELREKPAGTIRITATEYAAEAILMPAMSKILPAYPDIKVEVMIDVGLTPRNSFSRLRTNRQETE
jgi:DNA-binding transcriptional LysR family regulator